MAEVDHDSLWRDVSGEGGPTLVLLHGMTATGRVWDGVVECLRPRWSGRIVVPDLSGHGRSPHRAPYSYGSMAADVAAVVPREGDVAVVGHSLGGVVALALGSGWFGCRVRDVIALSVKVTWSDDDLARAATLAAKPPAWFDDESEAVDRYLRVSGLATLTPPSSPVALAGITVEDGRFRVAHDPATAALGAPDLAGLLAASRAHVLLGRGSEDPMVGQAELLELDDAPIELEGLGHNPHVEAPQRVADLIVSHLVVGGDAD